MKREQIEEAAKEAVQNHFQCNGKYPCEEHDYCEFCNGHNSAPAMTAIWWKYIDSKLESGIVDVCPPDR